MIMNWGFVVIFHLHLLYDDDNELGFGGYLHLHDDNDELGFCGGIDNSRLFDRT